MLSFDWEAYSSQAKKCDVNFNIIAQYSDTEGADVFFQAYTLLL